MYTLTTQEHGLSATESRIVESLAFCHAMGEKGGFFKVQIIDNENDQIIAEYTSLVA